MRLGPATVSLGLALVLGAARPAAAQEATRPQAIEHSDAYYTRLTVHRVGSYAMLPLFAGEYLLGRELMSTGDVAGWVKPTHTVVAGALGALFVVNTVTGAMNLWEDRHEEQSRGRRLLHAALMTAADAGFAYTGLSAGDAGHSDVGARRHRNAALTSIGISTAGTLLMWIGN